MVLTVGMSLMPWNPSANGKRAAWSQFQPATRTSRIHGLELWVSNPNLGFSSACSIRGDIRVALSGQLGCITVQVLYTKATLALQAVISSMGNQKIAFLHI